MPPHTGPVPARRPADPFAEAGLEPPAPTDPARIGPYRIAGRLGAGGMGTVYAAVDAAGHPAALKMVHREYAADPEFRARFRREVDLIGRVRSHCTPEFRGADTDAEHPWLATEYVPGPTLRRHVRAHGPLTGPMLMGLAAGIAEALHAIHGLGIVHRDLKPGNIILAPGGPKVLDFGIARAVEESAITRSGGLFGTAGWLAPEQYQEAEVAPEADMFGWGGLVSFSATGRNPFGTGEPAILAFRTMEDPADTEGTPDILLPLVHAALAKDPAQRPTAAAALAEVTRLWTGDDPRTGHAAAPPTPTPAEAADSIPGLLGAQWTGVPSDSTATADRATQWASLARLSTARTHGRRRRIALATGAAAAAVAVGAAGWLLGTPDTPPRPDTGAATPPGTAGTAPGDTPATPRPTRGGANLIGGTPEEERPIGALEATTNWNGDYRTMTLEVNELIGSGENRRTGPARTELTLTFQGIEKNRSSVALLFDATYERNSGTFTVHSSDFAVRVPDDADDPGGTPDGGSSGVTDPGDAEVRDHTPSSSAVLHTLTPDDDTARIRVPFDGIPELGAIIWSPDPTRLWGFPADKVNTDSSFACYNFDADLSFTAREVQGSVLESCSIPQNWS